MEKENTKPTQGTSNYLKRLHKKEVSFDIDEAFEDNKKAAMLNTPNLDDVMEDAQERKGIDEALVTLNKKLAVRYAKGGDLYEEKQEWISVDTPPKETGRYWCYVKEQNDLGISYYQWNCAYTKGIGFVRPDRKAIGITHWQPLPAKPTN